MGWWFGRKSAPADARPFVPAWLTNESAEEGFARSYSAQFDEVYRRNPVGQRAVRLVAWMLGSLTIDALEGDARNRDLHGHELGGGWHRHDQSQLGERQRDGRNLPLLGGGRRRRLV